MMAPFLAAALGVVIGAVLLSVSTTIAVVGAVMGALAVTFSFGYLGALPKPLLPGYWTAPGVQAGIDRMRGIEDPLIGEAIRRIADESSVSSLFD